MCQECEDAAERAADAIEEKETVKILEKKLVDLLIRYLRRGPNWESIEAETLVYILEKLPVIKLGNVPEKRHTIKMKPENIG
jgi:hypothetical protein